MSEFAQFLSENKERLYYFAKQNTKYDAKGRPTISKDDEWVKEKEWDMLFTQINGSKSEKHGNNI